MKTTLDIAVLILYVLGVVGLGCWFAKRSTTTSGFMVAGGSLPSWAVGLSIFGTFVSSISFLANPGKSFADNWNPFVFSLSLPVAAWIATRYFVPFFRKTGEVSAYSHLEARFGPWARVYAVSCYLLTQIARIGTILYLVALALAPLTGWNVFTIIIVTGILVTLYTLIGGIEAVIWTDVAQSIVLTLGLVVVLILLFFRMPEGPGQVFEIANASNKFSLGDFGASLSAPTFWVILFYGLFINLQNFGIDQSYVQRYATTTSERAAKKSVWLGALLYIPISALLFLVGTALFAFYTAYPDRLPLLADGSVVADQVFPHFIATELPAGVTGLLIAAILAAAMSSVDSSLNGSATLVWCDLVKRFGKHEHSEREGMRVLHLATIVFGVIGTSAALAMTQVRSALDAWWSLAGIFSGGMLGLFLLGLIVRRAGNAAGAIGTTVGVLVIFWLSLSTFVTLPPSLKLNLHSNLTIVVGTLTIFLVGLFISRLQAPRSR